MIGYLPQFNDTWLRRGYRTRLARQPVLPTPHSVVLHCRAANGHEAHLEDRAYCPGHRFDRT